MDRLYSDYGLDVQTTFEPNDTANLNITYINAWFTNDTDAQTVTIGDANWHAIDLFSDSVENGVTLTNNTTITILDDGVYKWDYSISFLGGTSQEYDVALTVNGVVQPTRIVTGKLIE